MSPSEMVEFPRRQAKQDTFSLPRLRGRVRVGDLTLGPHPRLPPQAGEGTVLRSTMATYFLSASSRLFRKPLALQARVVSRRKPFALFVSLR